MTNNNAKATVLIGNTPTGSGILVHPNTSGTATTDAFPSVQFANVTIPGTTTVTISSTGPTAPSGFQLASNPPVYYDFTATPAGMFTPPVRVRVRLPFGTQNPQLLHFEGGAWVSGLNISIDATQSVICGDFNSLSPFAVFISTMNPFASLSATLKINGPGSAFNLHGNFTLGAGSDGIVPLTKATAIQLGPMALTIPAGAFRSPGNSRQFHFEGTIGSAHLQINIRPQAPRHSTSPSKAAASTSAASPIRSMSVWRLEMMEETHS